VTIQRTRSCASMAKFSVFITLLTEKYVNQREEGKECLRFDGNCGNASVPQHWAVRVYVACLVSFTIAFDIACYIILLYFILCYITLSYVILYYITLYYNISV
jgi:hypothetical protein